MTRWCQKFVTAPAESRTTTSTYVSAGVVGLPPMLNAPNGPRSASGSCANGSTTRRSPDGSGRPSVTQYGGVPPLITPMPEYASPTLPTGRAVLLLLAVTTTVVVSRPGCAV